MFGQQHYGYIWLRWLTFYLVLYCYCSVVWIILALELLFEFLIRASDYKELIRSDKAFAPSTARQINFFHLLFESLSLLLFIPQFPCVLRKDCGDSIPFSNVWASVNAVTSTSETSAIGHFCLGLSFLKAFGLFRHWKQMWISRTFSKEKTDSCESSCCCCLFGFGFNWSPLTLFLCLQISFGGCFYWNENGASRFND